MKHTLSTLLFLAIILPLHVFAQSGGIDIKNDSELDKLIALKTEMTKKNELGHRYKIQLGSFSSMKNAKKVKESFESEFKDLPAELRYESPNYKVWIGNFTTRLSADRVYLKLKDDYKSAFVFKPTS